MGMTVIVFRGRVRSVTLARMYSPMTEQLLVHIDRVARESASPIGVPIEISSMMVFTAKTASVKISGVKRAAVSIALRENRRRRSERQRNGDCDDNFGAHCPSPFLVLAL